MQKWKVIKDGKQIYVDIFSNIFMTLDSLNPAQ